MAQGSGSATAVITAVLCLLLLHSPVAEARNYTVGDAKGWSFNVTNWTKGKQFRANDILVFKYRRGAHNVVVLPNNNKVAYNWCMKTRKSKVYQSGNDSIKLLKGNNFFICGFQGHCQAGMKIAIKAA